MALARRALLRGWENLLIRPSWIISAAVIGEYARHQGLVRIGKQSKTKGDFEREWEFLIRKELSSSEILNRDECDWGGRVV